MGRFRGGLRCIKYLLLGFNLLFWVRPEPAGQLGAGVPREVTAIELGPGGRQGVPEALRRQRGRGRMEGERAERSLSHQS